MKSSCERQVGNNRIQRKNFFHYALIEFNTPNSLSWLARIGLSSTHITCDIHNSQSKNSYGKDRIQEKYLQEKQTSLFSLFVVANRGTASSESWKYKYKRKCCTVKVFPCHVHFFTVVPHNCSLTEVYWNWNEIIYDYDDITRQEPMSRFSLNSSCGASTLRIFIYDTEDCFKLFSFSFPNPSNSFLWFYGYKTKVRAAFLSYNKSHSLQHILAFNCMPINVHTCIITSMFQWKPSVQ